MHVNFRKKLLRSLFWFMTVAVALYALGRLYYATTGGFTIGNITHPLPYNSSWAISFHPSEEQAFINQVVTTPYHYLGKGCQAYVFESSDGQYVMKFPKYQKFRPTIWLDAFSFIPFIDNMRHNKVISKKKKLESMFVGWKIAFENLNEESGVVYLHLNKTAYLNKKLLLIDKIGIKHTLNLDDYEFMIQRKASLLCPTIKEMMAVNKTEETKALLDTLLYMILNEYKQGFADNDHALMQNTGIYKGKPIHIDVGQFVRNLSVKNSPTYHQEIFNKTWKFRNWLEAHYPELAKHLHGRLEEIIGKENLLNMKPILNKADVGVLSHQEF